MKPRLVVSASALVVVAGVFILASCSTPQARISDRPAIYQSLAPGDQALVSQGRIRAGMSRDAVWLAWGSPDRRIISNVRGRATETWVYTSFMTYPYYPYGYPFNDLYDPFYYADVAPAIPYPCRLVTFRYGRVVAFHYQLSS